jgi:hypothetical protein
VYIRGHQRCGIGGGDYLGECNILGDILVILTCPIYKLIYDIEYSEEACLLLGTWGGTEGWKSANTHRLPADQLHKI